MPQTGRVGVSVAGGGRTLIFSSAETGALELLPAWVAMMMTVPEFVNFRVEPESWAGPETMV